MMRAVFLSLIFILSSVQGFSAKKAEVQPTAKGKKTICLNMIVKDESPVIRNCLASVKDFIDYWVIVDTGSNDGTQDIIKECMKGIPGKLYERPWKNFAHNRNEALKYAQGKGDYLMFIDADEVLMFDKDFVMPELQGDGYLIPVLISQNRDVRYLKGFLIDNSLDWRWEGVLHEQLKCSKNHECTVFPKASISAVSTQGYRSRDPNKYMKDAMVLEEALKEDPNNSRYAYYLAQSYFNAQAYEQAIKAFAKRAELGGPNDEEAFWSKYSIGFSQQILGQKDKYVKSYCDAYQYRTSRGEPVFRLAEHFFQLKYYIISYALAKYGMTIPVSEDILYVETWMYDYGFLYIAANSAALLGKFEEAAELYEKLLERPDFPEKERKETQSNLAQVKAQIFMQKQQQAQ